MSSWTDGCECPPGLECSCGYTWRSYTGEHTLRYPPGSLAADEEAALYGMRRTNPGRMPAHYIADDELMAAWQARKARLG